MLVVSEECDLLMGLSEWCHRYKALFRICLSVGSAFSKISLPFVPCIATKEGRT